MNIHSLSANPPGPGPIIHIHHSGSGLELVLVLVLVLVTDIQWIGLYMCIYIYTSQLFPNGVSMYAICFEKQKRHQWIGLRKIYRF